MTPLTGYYPWDIMRAVHLAPRKRAILISMTRHQGSSMYERNVMKLTDIIDNANIKEEFLWIVDDRSDETDMPCRFVKELNRQCDQAGWWDIFAETDKYVIFGECADGDQLVLLQNGRVIRYQPENPDCDEKWENLPEFFYESLQ